MSLKKIAQTLGISVTTASRALNDHDDVAKETKRKVFKAAKAMGYRPNASARSLKMGKSYVIGLVYPFDVDVLNDICFTQMIDSLNKELNQLGFDLLLIPDENKDEIPVFHRLLSSQRVDALLIAHTFMDDARLRYLVKHQFPFIALGRSNISAEFAWFDFDNQQGIRMAIDYLVQQGHQKIAYIGGNQPLTFIHLRRTGYVLGMQSAQLAFDDEDCRMTEMNRRGGYQACQALLTRHVSQIPTAIITDCNMIADGAATALEQYMQCNPKRTKPVLVTYDGLPLDTLSNYPYFTITQSTRNLVGKQIANMLVQLLAGEEIKNLQVLWQPVLKIHSPNH